MTRQLNRVLSGMVETRRSRSLRNRLAMTTILAVVPFLGYGRQVYAACDPSPSPIFVCSDVSPAQDINYADADVSTVPGFSIPAGVGNAMSITGDGHLQFTDSNASVMTGTGIGLYMHATGDSASNDGAITINANSIITGGTDGIVANNEGAGGIDITFNGQVTGQDGDGIHSNNSANSEGDLTITTAATSSVTGSYTGISAFNRGDSDLKITVNGDVEGEVRDGIYGYNDTDGHDLTITQGVTSTVTGAHVGIGASNHGDGDLHITANGYVYGNSADGIYANNVSQSDSITVETGAQSNVFGYQHGIDVTNNGQGDLNITADGYVTGYNFNGIHTFNQGDGDNLTIETGSSSYVYGNDNGIYARNYGSGDLKVTANGIVTGYNYHGINVVNQGNGNDLTVETGAVSDVYGYINGINAINLGSGDLNVTAKGIVTGERYNGIYAFNSVDGSDLTITADATSVITGGTYGIYARNYGSGDLTITADGEVTGENEDGILAINVGTVRTPDNYGGYYYDNGDGHDLTVTTGANSVINGDEHGIRAINAGDGDLTITANGVVYGYDEDGILAVNVGGNGYSTPFSDAVYFGNGHDLTITTGAQSNVSGDENGIRALNYGDGDLDITANGVVYGDDQNGIFAYNSFDGHDLTVTTGGQSDVFGYEDGIHANNLGDGDLTITANGKVTGHNEDGIEALNSFDGHDLTVTTGAASSVRGEDDGIDAEHEGDGDLEVTVGGTVTGEDGEGIESFNNGGGETNIKVEAGGLVQGNNTAIDAFSNGGQDIAIINDGTVRNLSTYSDDRAIYAHGGAVDITTNGVLIGTVATDLGTDFDDDMENGGFWNPSGGNNEFGGGNDEFTNTATGRLLTADDPAAEEDTDFSGLEKFSNAGLVSLVDGQPGDQVNLNDGAEYEGDDGRLAVDAVLGPSPSGLSDRLFVNGGDITGTPTRVHVNVVAANGANLDGITVVEVGGNTVDGDFVLDGPLNAGFFAWDIRRDGNIHELFTSGVGLGSYEFAAGISGGQEVWHQTTGTLLQRQADLRALLNGTGVTPVADYGETVAPTPAAHITPGFWLRGLGAYIERDDEENGFVLDRKQTIFGGMAGFDFGSEGAGDVWMFGIFGGYITSDLDFTETNSEWTYEGPTVGAYASYLDQGLYADVTVKADFLDVNIDPDDLAPASDDEDTDALNLGARIDAGYKIGETLFIEPQATLAVLHTEIDDVDIFGGTVEFDDTTSFRGRLGLRVGFDHTDNAGTVYSADVTGSAWEDFSGDNEVTIAGSGLPNFSVSDDPGQTIGDASLGFSVASPEGWSGFLRGNYLFGEDYEAVSGNAGVRWAW